MPNAIWYLGIIRKVNEGLPAIMLQSLDVEIKERIPNTEKREERKTEKKS